MTTEPTPSPTAAIAGFRRQLGALVLDGLVLGSIGFVLGAVFYDRFVEAGQLGRLVGLAVALPYLSILNSSLGAGQTVGKRAFGIRVVGRDARPIGFAAAGLRASVLALPWALNGLVLGEDIPSFFYALVVFGLFGVGGAIVYLAIANRQSRQSLHDLVAGTWVVSATSRGNPPTELPRVHAVVVAAILLVSLLLPTFDSRLKEQFPAVAELSPIQTAIHEAIPGSAASVQRGSTTMHSGAGTTTTTYLQVDLSLPQRTAEFDPIADDVASIVLERSDSLRPFDLLTVTVRYGYDILIASAFESRRFSFPPAEWHERLDSSGGQ